MRRNFKEAPLLFMRLDERSRTTLMKRELALKRLVRQMELDKLSSSTVFKNLQHELRTIKQQLVLQNASD